jgi:hypothetical protein
VLLPQGPHQVSGKLPIQAWEGGYRAGSDGVRAGENLAAEARALGAACVNKPFFPADIENALCGIFAAWARSSCAGFSAQRYPPTTAARS